MEAVLFVGIQGSGKSTFYKERYFDTHVRVSRDMLKTPARERALLSACLAAKLPFVLDNTNAQPTSRAEVIAAAKAAGFRVVGCYFASELRAALWRNSRRPQVVPRLGVVATWKRLQPPTWSEGFNELKVVEIPETGGFFVRDLAPEDGDPPKA